MNKTTHIVAGITAGVAVNKFIAPNVVELASVEGFLGIGAVMGGAFLGSVLPDIDHKGSFIGRRLKPISFVVQHTLGHRGLTHSPLFIMGLTLLLGFLTLQLDGFGREIMLMFVLGLFGGMASHLFMDMLTISGIPLLYPFSDKKFSIAPFKTGGIGEYIASIGCIIFVIWMMNDVSMLAFLE